MLKKDCTEWMTFKLRPEGGEEVKRIKIERDGYSKLNEWNCKGVEIGEFPECSRGSCG